MGLHRHTAKVVCPLSLSLRSTKKHWWAVSLTNRDTLCFARVQDSKGAHSDANRDVSDKDTREDKGGTAHTVTTRRLRARVQNVHLRASLPW